MITRLVMCFSCMKLEMQFLGRKSSGAYRQMEINGQSTIKMSVQIFHSGFVIISRSV